MALCSSGHAWALVGRLVQVPNGSKAVGVAVVGFVDQDDIAVGTHAPCGCGAESTRLRSVLREREFKAFDLDHAIQLIVAMAERVV